jgi:ribosome maturation factor RimP
MATLDDIIEPAVTALGFELVGTQPMSEGQRQVIRVFVDGPNGVTIEDCAKISRQVGAVMDVEEPIKGNFRLEVSSPGIQRPLFKLPHYVKYVGQRVKVRLHRPVNNQRNYVAVLMGVDGSEISLETDNGVVKVNFEDIQKGRLVIDV